MEHTHVVAFVAVGATMVAFIAAVRMRLFGRVPHGFLIALVVAVAGAGLVTAGLLGLWGFAQGEHILFREFVDQMHTLGEVVAKEVQSDLRDTTIGLERLAREISPETARQHPQRIQEALTALQAFDPHLLQLSIVDVLGRPLVEATPQGEPEPIGRVGAAYGLEGKVFTSEAYLSPTFKRWVVALSVPMKGPDGAVRGAVSARYDVQADFGGLLAPIRFGKSGHVVLVDQTGRVLAHPAQPGQVGEDLSAYPAVREALQGRSGWIVARNAGGVERLVAYRPMENPATAGRKPWVLLSEVDADEALAPIHSLRTTFIVALVVLVAICLLVASQVSLSIRGPLARLVRFVKLVRGGDLTQRTHIAGRDEIAELAEALDEMVRGLQERDRVKEIFGRYVTTQISEEVLKGEVSLGGRRRRVTILLSDIRNFTTMSERMAPEDVVSFLNDYFSEMVDAVFEHGGVLDKFIGDGMLAVFGSIDEEPDHARRAVRAALRMKVLLAKLNGERAVAGRPPINIGIGIHTDDVIVGNIGSRRRLEYTVIGDGVNTCSRVEALNKEFGTTVLITEATYAEAGEEFECRLMPETSLRGKAKALRVYEVVSRKVATAPASSVSPDGR
jgi:class 3 adenylate cyclase